ncbi:MAG TPA: recombinase family protein [Steroidobacteraceae bacterium]
MKRAATYARFSTDKQTETSIDDQRRACNEYAKQNGLKVVHEFADLAISGASFGNRPGVTQLQKAAFAGEIDVIIIADLTRLSRNSADLPKFLERVRFRGVRVIGVLDRFDSDQRHSRMQAGLSGIMSDEYRAAVGERVHLALDTLAKNSKATGGVAYGYTSKRKIVPDQARIVKQIFKRIADGETMKAIVCDFNARGVPSPGAAWKRTSNFAKLEAERQALVREAKRVVRGPLISGPWGVEAEYRKQAQQMRDDLTGEDADAARAALVAIYGPRIPLRPHPSGQFLIAETVLQTNVLLRASGSGRICQSSGGLLLAHIPLTRKG